MLTRYYQLAWLPTVGGFFDYAMAFQNNNFGKLWANNYSYSFVGLSLQNEQPATGQTAEPATGLE